MATEKEEMLAAIFSQTTEQLEQLGTISAGKSPLILVTDGEFIELMTRMNFLNNGVDDYNVIYYGSVIIIKEDAVNF